MEHDYTHLNHNLLLSQKKSGQQGHDYKGGLLYWETLSEFLEFVREAKGNIQNSFKIITTAFFVENFLQKDKKFGIYFKLG
jgi:hypothetical protein